MTVPDESISDAKRAMAAGDFAGALMHFKTADLSALEPLAAIRALLHMGTCAHKLGRTTESIAHQRQGLSIMETGALGALPALEIKKLELLLSIGSYDVSATKSLLPAIFPEHEIAPHEFRIAPVMDVRAWCREYGAQARELDSSEREAAPAWHAVIPEAEILAGWDFVVAATGEVLEGANHSPVNTSLTSLPHVLNPLLALVAHVWPSDCTTIDEDVLFLVTSEGHHFGHWTAEFLPRLRAWDRTRKLAIAASLPRKHRDLLMCFGVTQADLVECEMGRRYKFRSVQAVYAGPPTAPSRANTAFLYEAFGPKRRATPTRKLFLVRDAGTRLPVNDTELDAVLTDFGVEKVNPARLSYAEQQDLLADTSVIIGAYGTELYCMLNMQAGATVIELIWDTALATVYGPTAAYVGLNHHLVLCTRAKDRGKVRHNIDGDMIVDCAMLRDKLTLTLGPAKRGAEPPAS